MNARLTNPTHRAWRWLFTSACVLTLGVSAQAGPDGGVTRPATRQRKAPSPFDPITDVPLVVELLNSDPEGFPEFFPRRVDPAAVEAVVFRPRVLQGLGSVLIKFKQRSGALSDDAWNSLVARAERVPPTAGVVRALKTRLGARLAPEKQQLAHLVVDPNSEDEWNHGTSSGVTLLDGGAVVFWYEYW
jgi:hypothetical protein